MADDSHVFSESDPPAPRLPHQVGSRRPAGEPTLVMMQPPSFWSRALSWLGWGLLGICFMVITGMYTSRREYFDMTGGIREKYHSLSKMSAKHKVAVIDISGVIMGGDGFVKRQIDRVRDDASIKGVVLRIDSPGGTITGSDYLYHHLSKLRKERELPMVVSMGSMAASGGYYIAMAVGPHENVIFAEHTTTTGSIGVIIPHYDVTGLMNDFNIKNDSISTHPRKQMLSMTRTLAEDERVLLENYIGHAFDRFKMIIRENRPYFQENSSELDRLATGEIFTAQQAKDLGLVDSLGFIEEAIDRVLELASLDKTTTRVVTYSRPATLVEAVGLGQAQSESLSPFSLSHFLQLNSPQAYYLATSLPELVSTRFDK